MAAVGTNSSPLIAPPPVTTSYWVSVSNACGATASNTVTVTICTPPSITTQPVSQSVIAGSPATLSVTASGDGPITYQWYQGATGTPAPPLGPNTRPSTVTPP